jgi:predicted RNA-binding protein with PIN domain
MSLSYLIDGYNLLHAMVTLSKRAGPGVLEKARLRLLDLLSHSFGDQPAHVTVVFDASGAPAGSLPEHKFHGMNIRFALHGKEADDIIEDLIGHDAAPKQLTVVSNDHRLQQAARRRKANVQSCEDFLDMLARLRRQRPKPPDGPEKKEGETQEETKRLLQEFGDLDHELGDINWGF